MFKRAKISLVIAGLAATSGFVGLLDASIAQTLFYAFMGFSVVSTLLGFFEVDVESGSGAGKPAVLRRRIIASGPPRVAP